MSEKVGRNDPCPCGSGKKYKKCCGFKVQEQKQLSARHFRKGIGSGTAGMVGSFVNQMIPTLQKPLQGRARAISATVGRIEK